MKVKLFKCDWGMEYIGPPEKRLAQYKAAGYDGVECANIGMEPEAFADTCDELGLAYIAMVFSADPASFKTQLDQVLRARPMLINCHPGCDYFTFEQGCDYFKAVMDIAAEVDTPVVYETHRRRCLYAPWTTARYLEAIPELRICADFSHFTTVAECALDESPYRDFLELAISRTDHIHARVGYSHGPQVPDPRVGEGLIWTELFESWWDRIIQQRQAEGKEFMTINPEFGPPLYQPFDPVTREPLADIWDCCLFIANRFRERWNS